MSPTERDRLIDALIDSDISEADFLRLEAEMSIDPEVRKAYYERLELSVLLETTMEAEVVPLEQPLAPFRRWSSWGLTAIGAAAVVALVSGIFFGGEFKTAPEELAAEKQATGFGVLVGQVDATWANTTVLKEGQLVPPGLLQLLSGVAQIELFSGVSVVVQGAAEFEIHSPMDVSMRVGKLRARVPEAAQGFRVRSTEGDVVDLGTEFAINVMEGQSQVHVLDGEVEWHPRRGTTQLLDGGQAMNWHESGQSQILTADETAFIGVEEVGEKRIESRSSRMERWMSYSTKLQSDPRLIAYYKMAPNDPWSRRLKNISDQGSDRVGEGAVVAASAVADRWGAIRSFLGFFTHGQSGPDGCSRRVSFHDVFDLGENQQPRSMV